MKKNLVLISHGYFCEELKKSLEMIMGNQETIYTVPFLASESSEAYFKKLETIVSPLDQVTIIADLMGGERLAMWPQRWFYKARLLTYMPE